MFEEKHNYLKVSIFTAKTGLQTITRDSKLATRILAIRKIEWRSVWRILDGEYIQSRNEIQFLLFNFAH